MQELGSKLLGGLAAAVAARRGLDLGVAGELLDGAEIGAPVKQVADERPSQVVRRKCRDAGLKRASSRDLSMACPDIPPLLIESKVPSPGRGKRATPGRLAGIAQMRQALLVALAPYL